MTKCSDKQCAYLKSINQPSPRLCIICRNPEEIIVPPSPKPCQSYGTSEMLREEESKLQIGILDKKRILEKFNGMRNDFAIQMLASLVNASRQNGTLPNADMMAKESLKYADALIAELSK